MSNSSKSSTSTVHRPGHVRVPGGIASTVAALACWLLAAPSAAAALHFTEVGEQAGVRVVHDSRGYSSAGHEIQDLYGPGVAWADVNNDGWLDLFVANGAAGNHLFLNNCDGTFTDVSQAWGVAVSRVANGVAFADVDNNGSLDLAIGNFWAEPQLFKGGAPPMQEIGTDCGLNPLFYAPDPFPPFGIEPETMGMAFGDYNQDGFVDLYVSNYLRQPDLLMESVTGDLFIRTDKVNATDSGYGFQGVFLDFDNDNDLDIFVTNDFGYDYLFENQGRDSGWTFIEKAQIYKVAGGGSSAEEHSMGMGVAAGDYDNDGDLDLYITNYNKNSLFENLGLVNGFWRFRERAAEAGVEDPLNCWAVDFCDLDLDGDLDLVQASGYIFADVNPQPLDLPNKVYLNNGGPAWTFTEVGAQVGFDDRMMARGMATGDFDRDGDVDIVVANNTFYQPAPDAPNPTVYEGHLLLYRNDQDFGRHWVNLKLQGGGVHAVGLGCNRAAVGARVYLTAGGITQMREVQASGSYCSQNSLELEFGLGDATTIDDVRVRWICGAEEHFTGVAADHFWVLREGAGQAQSVPVALISFDAVSTPAGVRLEWVTSPEAPVMEATVLRKVTGDAHGLLPLSVDVRQQGNRGSSLDASVTAGVSYEYQLVLVGPDRVALSSAVVQVTAGETGTIAQRPRLAPSFPNPFNPTTTIVYEVPRATDAKLVLIDARGRVVRTLVNARVDGGSHAVSWDGADDHGAKVGSGSYTAVLTTPLGGSSRILTLAK